MSWRDDNLVPEGRRLVHRWWIHSASLQVEGTACFEYHISVVVVVVVVIIRFSIIHLFTRLLFKWKARLVSIPHLNHLPLSQISEQLFHSKTILPGCFEITSPF